MDWNEFLKPDLRKMLLLLILIGILFLIPITITIGTVCSCTASLPCNCPETKIIETSLGMETIGIQISQIKHSPSTAIFFIPIVVVELFVLYLLACILSSVYDKVKTKN